MLSRRELLSALSVAPFLGVHDRSYGAPGSCRPSFNVRTEYGAKGDGTTDDTKAFQAALTAAGQSGGPAELIVAAGTYRTTDQLTVPDGVHVLCEGAIFRADLQGAGLTAVAFDLGSRTSIEGCTIAVAAATAPGSGDRKIPIRIARVDVPGGRQGVVVRNVVLDGTDLWTTVDGANGIAISQDSHDILIENIHAKGAGKLGNAVTVNWGYDGKATTNGTTHPYNLVLRNICLEDGLDVDTNGVLWLSGCYNVVAENIMGLRVGRGITVYAGDYGARFAPAVIRSRLCTGISLTNVYAEVTRRGVVFGGKPARQGENVPFRASLSNATLVGVGPESRNAIAISSTEGVTVADVSGAGFTGNGVEITRSAAHIQLRNVDLQDLGGNGIRIEPGAGESAEDVRITGGAIANSSQKLGSGASAHIMVNGAGAKSLTDVVVEGVIFSAASGESASRAILGTAGVTRLRVSNTHTRNLLPGAAAIVADSDANAGGNTAGAGVTLLAPGGAVSSRRAVADSVGGRSGLVLGITTVSRNYRVGDDDFTILADASGEGLTITLPSAAMSLGRVVVVKKVDLSTGTVTVTSQDAHLDGASARVLRRAFESMTVQCDGREWFTL